MNRIATALVAALLAAAPVAPVAEAALTDFLGDLNLVSVEQEAQVAATFAREIESKNRLARDAEVRRYVSELGARLAGGLRKADFRYRFRVVESREINAYNIGGGWIYVNTGLIAGARSEGELAAVMAHEMGHQVKRHVAKAISRDQMFRSLAAFAVGGNASQWVQLAAALGVTTGQLHFGREAERQADRVMVDLMPAAGYDPRQALAMFDTLRRLQGNTGGGIFSSHPPTKERAQNVAKLIRQRAVAGGLARDSRRFQDVKARVLGR